MAEDLKEEFEKYGSLDKFNEKMSTREKLGMEHIEIENLSPEEDIDIDAEREQEIEELIEQIHKESSFEDKDNEEER